VIAGQRVSISYDPFRCAFNASHPRERVQKREVSRGLTEWREVPELREPAPRTRAKQLSDELIPRRSRMLLVAQVVLLTLSARS